MASLYWIHDGQCSDPLTEGYIGITKRNPEKRFSQHKYLGRVPKDSIMQILFEGTLEECKLKEREYRPRAKIGWNDAKGGGGGGMIGKSHSEETKAKMRAARLKYHAEHPNHIKGNSFGKALKGIKKPPGHAEKLREIAKKRYKITKPDGSWTWCYRD
jgi:hypothetical protein